jgi:hypothetical protein
MENAAPLDKIHAFKHEIGTFPLVLAGDVDE